MPVTLVRPYATLRDVQRECRNVDTGSAEDDMREAINQASRMVDDMVNRDFFYHDHASSALRINSSWITANTIYLPWPILTLTEVKLNGEVQDAEGWVWENDAHGCKAGRIIRKGYAWSGEILEGGSNGFDFPLTDFSPVYDRLNGTAFLPPGVASPSPAVLQMEIKGTFGYAPRSPGDTTLPSVDIPPAVRRATTQMAAAMSGHFRKSTRGFDGSVTEVSDTRLPTEAVNALKAFKYYVL